MSQYKFYKMVKNKLYKILLINILNFILISKICATDAQQVFQEANQAYTSGNFSLAVEKYEAILKENAFSKELYYNLGSSYFRLNQIGKAVLNFERALRLAPSDKDIQNNLEFSRGRIVEDIEPISNFFIIQWWNTLRDSLSADSWSFLTLLFLWLGIAGFIVWLLAKERLLKKRGFIAGIILIPLSIIFYLLAQDAQNEVVSSRYAIIIVSETPFRPSPDMNTIPVAKLHEGIKVEILDTLSHFYKVRLPNGEEGWMAEGSIEKI